MPLIRRLGAYVAHPDPLVAAANRIALIVGLNMPFYPLFAILATGSGGMPSTLLGASATPFFLAVPAISRSHPLVARAMISIIGAVNTVFITWVLGEASGTQMFFLPVAMAAALLFRRHEAWLMLALLGLCLAAFLGLQGHYGMPPHLFDEMGYRGLMRMNAFGVAGLTGFMGLVFSGMVGRPGPR